METSLLEPPISQAIVLQSMGSQRIRHDWATEQQHHKQYHCSGTHCWPTTETSQLWKSMGRDYTRLWNEEAGSLGTVLGAGYLRWAEFMCPNPNPIHPQYFRMLLFGDKVSKVIKVK